MEDIKNQRWVLNNKVISSL